MMKEAKKLLLNYFTPTEIECIIDDIRDYIDRRVKEEVEAVIQKPIIDTDQENDGEKCWVCGCTDDHACEGGCYWVIPGLCSRCAERMEDQEQKETLIDFLQRKAERAHHSSKLAAHNVAAKLIGRHEAFCEAIKFIKEAGNQ